MALFSYVVNFFIVSLFKEALCYYAVPQVEFNFDTAPATRWHNAIDAILSAHSWNDTFGMVFREVNESLFDHIPSSDYSIFTSAIQRNWPQNYEELQGISSYFASKYNQIVTVEYLSLWVYYHALSHVKTFNYQLEKDRSCTGVLVLDENDNIWHGRNMDQSYPQARNLTLAISFTKNGTELFKALDWYWFTTGIVTAFKSNVLSIQENYKLQVQSYDDVLRMVKNDRIPQVFLFRQILSNKDVTFNGCAQVVAHTPLISPMYVLIAGVSGVHDGLIITRYTDDSVVFDFANITTNSTGNYNGYNPSYYMVQTNYDLWQEDQVDDNRRSMAENMLSTWNRNEDTKLLYIGSNLQAIMSSYQVHNADTFYTGIFSVAHDVFLGYIRQAIVSVHDVDGCKEVKESDYVGDVLVFVSIGVAIGVVLLAGISGIVIKCKRYELVQTDDKKYGLVKDDVHGIN
eukprot:375261_1